MKRSLFLFVVCVFTTPFVVAQTVTLSTLLDEMIDRSAVARFPDPAYTCKQFSSYDRAATSPDEPGWFANSDNSQFLREETNGGRQEWVMMDAEGPGAIVRWWITTRNYDYTIRIYIDGTTEPVIEANCGELIGGDHLIGAPFSAERAGGRNLYLPIPYAKHVKITVDGMKPEAKGTPDEVYFFYIINYRTYAAGTTVKPFSKQELEANRERLEQVGTTLLEPLALTEGWETNSFLTLAPGETISTEVSESQALVLDTLCVQLEAEDLVQAFRSTMLKIECDDEPTVFCPVGEFFGSGVGLNPHKGWYMEVRKDGAMISRWRMPFREKIKVSFENRGDQEVKIRRSTRVTDWTWDDRSMYFHAAWRQERDIPVRPERDWEYIRLSGQGVYVGDVLSLLNHQPNWWGEGDEKIYVDGETFPSHFGTGTEDYYGYAWCSTKIFEAPFHAQPRAEGPRCYGRVTNLRVRSLDAIPFLKDFRFDMEIWPAVGKGKVDYSAATFWYGKPGTRIVDGPTQDAVVAEAILPVSYQTPEFMPDVPGFVFKNSPPGLAEQQRIHKNGGKDWKDGDQLCWRGGRPGQRIDLYVDLEKSGPQKVICALTKAPDYAIVRFYFNDEELGEPIDLYAPEITATGEIVIGTVDVPAGRHVLSVEIVGKNEKSRDHTFGFDTYRFE